MSNAVHQQDIEAIGQILEVLGRTNPGTRAMRMMIQDMKQHLEMQRILSEQCICDSQPCDWNGMLEAFETDGGVFSLREVA